MTLLEPRAERLQRGDGVALVIKNHVRRIEVHPNVWPAQLLQKGAERLRRFLARLKAQINAPRGEQIGNQA